MRVRVNNSMRMLLRLMQCARNLKPRVKPANLAGAAILSTPMSASVFISSVCRADPREWHHKR